MGGALPRKVQVGPVSYRVVTDAADNNRMQLDDGNCLYGRVHYPQQTIHVNPAQGPDNAKDTILHETVHALINQCGLRSRFDANAEEEFVTAFSTALLDCLQRNPKLVSYLTAS